MEDVSSYQHDLREKVFPSLGQLKSSKTKLEQAGAQSRMMHEKSFSTREYGQMLPPLAFQVARATKELVSNVESIEWVQGVVEENLT